MTTTDTDSRVDKFIILSNKWQEAYEKLRSIVLDCDLTEELKWGCPCYTTGEDRNIVLIHGFKEYCAFLFFKGALLQDDHGILVQQTKNVQGARQIRFTSARQIEDMEDVLRGYIEQAIAVEKAGLEVTLKKSSEYTVVEEFQAKCEEVAGLKDAFEALTPGRQRGYMLYFSAAKQAKTRVSRIDKYVKHILDGKGMDD